VINILSFSGVIASTVKVDVIHSQDRYHAGKKYPILFRLTILKSWYIHGTNNETEYLIPTTLSFEKSPVLEIRDIKFPKPESKKFEYSQDPVEVYSGDIYFEALLIIKKDTTPDEYIIKGNLSYQACTSNSCLPSEKIPIDISAVIVEEDVPVKRINHKFFHSSSDREMALTKDPNKWLNTGLWLTLMVFFLAGLGLNLTPCIYPLIPITVSYFGGRDKGKGSSILINGVLFIIGIAITNSFLGVFAALTGGILGSALQHPVILIFIAGVLIMLALSFFGMWELRVPATISTLASKNFKGYFGTFFMGLTLGIVAAPCVGPFILGLITYVAQKGDPITGFLYFFVLSIGMGLPLCLLAIFSGAISRLPMSGDWMVWVKKLMGWILISMAAYMLCPLVDIHSFRVWIFSGVAIAGGIHLGWIDNTGGTLRKFILFKKIFGLIIVCGALFYLTTAPDQREGVIWVPYEKKLVVKAAQDRKPIMLDFYADWCAPCREMEKTIFKDPEVLRLSKDFINLKVDLTKQAPIHDELLRNYNVIGVPTVIFLNREGKEANESRIVGLVEKSIFLERMKKALE
jgi:thiol:disulfide interchange protein DsbD